MLTVLLGAIWVVVFVTAVGVALVEGTSALLGAIWAVVFVTGLGLVAWAFACERKDHPDD